MKCYLYALLLTLALPVRAAIAQITITGRVMDKETKEALPGVSVFIPETQTGASTDNKGNFVLKPKVNPDTLIVSYLGYKTRTFPVSGNAVTIELEAASASLNEVIISGSREQQQRTEAPIAIHSISKLTLNETKATRLDLILNKTPGVLMVDLGNEQHSMSIRQPIGTRNLFLYLEDGVPIRTTGDFNHNGLIEINYSALNKIEVIKGPASSLYGSEAVGGAVNFITQSPSLVPTLKAQAETGSFGYKRTDFYASNTFKKAGLYVGGYYASRNQADNVHNDFEKLALTFRGDYTISETTKLIATGTYVDYFTDQIGDLDSARFFGKNYVSSQRFTYRKVNALRAKTTLQHDWSDKSNTNFTVFYRNSAIGQNPFYRIKSVAGNPLKARGEINEDAFQSFGAIAQHSYKFNFWESKLIFGASIDQSPATYDANFIAINRSAAGVYTDYTATDSVLTSYKVDLLNSAEYLQFEFRPLEKIKFVTALRYDRLDYKFDNHLAPSAFTGAPDEKNNFEQLTPKVGVTIDLERDRGLYLNYSTGFAPPNITDLYTGVKVPVLKPARYINYEGGGWLAFGKKGYADLSLYQMNGTDEIVSVRLPDGSTQNQNAGKTSHKGVEASFNYLPVPELTLRLGGTYARHKYVDYQEKGSDFSGNMMSQAPEYIANSEITYKPLFLKGFRVALEWQGVGSYFLDAQNSQKYDGYNIFNARAGYKWKNVEIWTNCLNLTNKIYATTASKSASGPTYRPGQLRTVNVGLGYTFTKKANPNE